MTKTKKGAHPCAAELIAKNLEIHGVTHVFGIPGAKVDRLFDVLADSSIETVVTRHEQNAAFIAGGIGRLTGKAGVCVTTSGPGVSNLVTGLATANYEGDPVLAIGGAVKLADRLKLTHQTMDTVSIFNPITKFSAEITSPLAVSEVMANAFRAAEGGRPGASFVSTPMDVLGMEADIAPLADHNAPHSGGAAEDVLEEAAEALKKAKRPVVLLGMLASRPEVANAVRRFLKTANIPAVGTYQAAGAVSEDLKDLFCGRVGLFPNQSGDKLLGEADVVMTVGYSPVEYDPWLWNVKENHKIISIDVVQAELDNAFVPQIELLGSIAPTLDALTKKIGKLAYSGQLKEILVEYHKARNSALQNAASTSNKSVHPLQIVKVLDEFIASDMTLCLDMGSFHIWIARYLLSFHARQVLISNGQQTMGVGLPWGIAACLTNPSHKVVSISGDGGFMMSCMELETAVRLQCNLIHIVWIDSAFNMVEMQEEKKYGRGSGVKFGSVDFAMYAKACGTHGVNVTTEDDFRKAMRDAMDTQGPYVIAVYVDYSQNHLLMDAKGKIG